jgi:hypothetical protein
MRPPLPFLREHRLTSIDMGCPARHETVPDSGDGFRVLDHHHREAERAEHCGETDRPKSLRRDGRYQLCGLPGREAADDINRCARGPEFVAPIAAGLAKFVPVTNHGQRPK